MLHLVIYDNNLKILAFLVLCIKIVEAGVCFWGDMSLSMVIKCIRFVVSVGKSRTFEIYSF